RSTLCYLRTGEGQTILAAFNFTPVPRTNYRIGVPEEGTYREVLNSDAETYGGGNIGNFGEVETHPVPYHGRNHSIVVTLPPLGAVFIEQKTDATVAPTPEVEISTVVEPKPAKKKAAPSAQKKTAAAPKKKAAPKKTAEGKSE
ncbi:MAG: alpha amylase C-terminal domain-containing protein, partial [Rhodothermales bacterium]|nr:alpha amylase C-terminal domain-containing protein [Rhodothermales bacterium]